eukprot:4384046-Amphidinium_carterae.1
MVRSSHNSNLQDTQGVEEGGVVRRSGHPTSNLGVDDKIALDNDPSEAWTLLSPLILDYYLHFGKLLQVYRYPMVKNNLMKVLTRAMWEGEDLLWTG